MEQQLTIEFIKKNVQQSDYDWANLSIGDNRVGKARCFIDGNTITIYSIIIFPEFQGNGYGKKFVDYSKQNFKKVIADRVRFNARGFWDKMNFTDMGNEIWVYEK